MRCARFGQHAWSPWLAALDSVDSTLDGADAACVMSEFGNFPRVSKQSINGDGLGAAP